MRATKLVPNAGTGMIEIVFGIGIFTFLAMSVLSLFIYLSKQQSQTATLVQIDVVRRNLIAVPLNGKAWKKTLDGAGNAGMQCLKTGQPCTVNGMPGGAPIQNRPFVLYDAASAVVFDATNPANGFTFAGAKCATFSNSGSDSCPFRFDLKWSAVCTPGNCVNPQVRIVAPLIYKPASKTAIIKPANYEVPEIFRSGQ